MHTAASRKKEAAYKGIYNRFVKRGLDICISGAAILILWPFYLIIGVLIAAEDGLPVLYQADRGGYRGRTFRICKFRTMVKNADQIGGGTTALNDPRITKIGNLLRKTKLDEIPQLFNIIGGRTVVQQQRGVHGYNVHKGLRHRHAAPGVDGEGAAVVDKIPNRFQIPRRDGGIRCSQGAVVVNGEEYV